MPAGFALGNGFGKFAGATQIEELGEIETPILLTNTLSVAEGVAGAIEWTLGRPGNEHVLSVNAVVGETNDGFLNDIRGRHVTVQHVLQAIATAGGGPVAEGCVGAGTGTQAFGWKGGIGTSSRRLPRQLGDYTLGVLVQTNYGGVLSIDGVPVGKTLGRYYLKDVVDDHGGDGSVVIVVATDAPLSDRNLGRPPSGHSSVSRGPARRWRTARATMPGVLDGIVGAPHTGATQDRRAVRQPAQRCHVAAVPCGLRGHRGGRLQRDAAGRHHDRHRRTSPKPSRRPRCSARSSTRAAPATRAEPGVRSRRHLPCRARFALPTPIPSTACRQRSRSSIGPTGTGRSARSCASCAMRPARTGARRDLLRPRTGAAAGIGAGATPGPEALGRSAADTARDGVDQCLADERAVGILPPHQEQGGDAAQRAEDDHRFRRRNDVRADLAAAHGDGQPARPTGKERKPERSHQHDRAHHGGPFERVALVVAELDTGRPTSR